MASKQLLVNGRPVIHTRSNGSAEAISINFTGPDRIPIPYNVRANTADLSNTCSGLQVQGNAVATIASFLRRCSGDESGDGGGIYSGTIGQRCDFLTASPDTLVSKTGVLTMNGSPILRENDLCILNNRNSAPTALKVNKKDLKGDSLKDRKGKQPSKETPYILDVAVFNQLETLCHSQLIANNDEQHAQPLCIAESQRVRFHNLNKEKIALNFSVPTISGETFQIPLATPQDVHTETDEDPITKQHPNSLMAVKFTTEKTINTPNQVSHLLTLPAALRKQVYDALGNTLDDNWYENLRPSLKLEVDHELDNNRQGNNLRPGFIYLFLNDQLWRELQINQDGMYCEIDLKKWARNDIRSSSGIPSNVVYLPINIAGKESKLEAAFSEIQWSWERIITITLSNKEESQRLTTLNLSQLQKPILYLPDPLGMIQAAVNDVMKTKLYPLQNVIVKLLEEIKQGDTGLHETLIDYFSLGMYHYEKAFDLIANITETLITSNIGKNCLKTWRAPDSPLFPYLFSTRKQTTLGKQFNIVFNQHVDAHGDGLFNGLLFAHSWYRLTNPCFEKLANRCQDNLHTNYCQIALHLLLACIDEPNLLEQAWKVISLTLETTNNPLISKVTLEKPIQYVRKQTQVIGYQAKTPNDPGCSFISKHALFCLAPDNEQNPWPEELRMIIDENTRSLNEHAFYIDPVNATVFNLFLTFNAKYGAW